METLHISTDLMLAGLMSIIAYFVRQKLQVVEKRLDEVASQAVHSAKLEGRLDQLDTKVDGIRDLVESKIDNLNDTLKMFMQKGRS